MKQNRILNNRWLPRMVGLLVPVLLGACSLPSGTPVWPACTPADSIIIVSGIFNATGESLETLEPVKRYNVPSTPVPCQPEGRFILEVTFTDGDILLVPFDALVADDAGETTYGFFEVTAPVPERVALVRIIASRGGKEFAHLPGPDIAP